MLDHRSQLACRGVPTKFFGAIGTTVEIQYDPALEERAAVYKKSTAKFSKLDGQ